MRTNERETERDKRKKKNDQTTRRRKYGREGEGFEKLNWTLTKDPRVTMNCYARLDVRKWSLSLLILLGRVSSVSGNFQSRKTGTKPPCFFSPFRLYDSSYRSILSFGFSFHVETFVSSMFVWETFVTLIRFCGKTWWQKGIIWDNLSRASMRKVIVWNELSVIEFQKMINLLFLLHDKQNFHRLNEFF